MQATLGGPWRTTRVGSWTGCWIDIALSGRKYHSVFLFFFIEKRFFIFNDTFQILIFFLNEIQNIIPTTYGMVAVGSGRRIGKDTTRSAKAGRAQIASAIHRLVISYSP